MNSCPPLYEKLEKDPDGLMAHFQKMLTEFRKDKSLLIEQKDYAYQPTVFQQIKAVPRVRVMCRTSTGGRPSSPTTSR